MDITCTSCNAIHDLTNLMERERIFSDSKSVIMTPFGMLYRKNGFHFEAPTGIKDAKGGRIILTHCPQCDETTVRLPEEPPA